MNATNATILVPLLLAIMLAAISRPSLGSSPEIVRSNLFVMYKQIYIVAFSPDGNYLGAGADSTDPAYGVFHVADLSNVWDRPYGFREAWNPTTICFADDNTMVAYASSGGSAALKGVPIAGGGVKLSDADENRGTAVAISAPTNCSRWAINAGPHGMERRRVFCSGTGWASDSPQTIAGSYFPMPHEGIVTKVIFDPGGSLFLLGTSQGLVQQWQIDPPQLLWETNFPNNYITAIDILQDRRQIVTLSSNTVLVNGEFYLKDIRLWEIGETNWIQTFRPDLTVSSTTLTPDGKYLFLPLLTSRFSIPFSPDYYTNHVSLWRVSDGQEMIRYTEDLPEVQQVAVAPDGKTFAYGRGDGILALARMPLLIDEVTHSGGNMILRWRGGAGLYQVQRTTNLVNGSWENVGAPTPLAAATNGVTGSVFYRVEALASP